MVNDISTRRNTKKKGKNFIFCLSTLNQSLYDLLWHHYAISWQLLMYSNQHFYKMWKTQVSYYLKPKYIPFANQFVVDSTLQHIQQIKGLRVLFSFLLRNVTNHPGKFCSQTQWALGKTFLKGWCVALGAPWNPGTGYKVLVSLTVPTAVGQTWLLINL